MLFSELHTGDDWKETPKGVDGTDDVTPEGANRFWLGTTGQVVAVAPRRHFIVDAAPHQEVTFEGGSRLEVVGVGGTWS